MSDSLILVDARNRTIGQAEKYAAHAAGLLHRAFSIILVDAQGRLLLQRRHPAKYHSGGLWANACCGHPRPGERTRAAAQRRLGEELGAEAPLKLGFSTRYRAAFSNGLVENEVVSVYFGPAPAVVQPNPDEITAIDWRTLAQLQSGIEKDPARYAFWFTHYLEHHAREIEAGVAGVVDTHAKIRG
jgi:isopentenyl-diphosphate Delta-isomerase